MTSVGVRELRQRASELLRQVEHGETIEITDRGRPVAILSPVATGGALDELRATGQIDPACGDLDDLPDPLPLAAGPTASDILAARRRDER